MIVKFLWFSIDLALVPKILIVYIFQNFHMYIWNVIIIFLGTRDLGCTASCCWSWLNPCTGDCGQCGGHCSECWFDNLLWWKRYLIHVVFFSDNDLYLIYVCPGFSCWKLISDFLLYLFLYLWRLTVLVLQNFLQVQNMNYPNMFWVSQPTWFEKVNT